MELEFGIRGIDVDWSQYTYSSDPGIMNQLFQENLGRLPGKADVAAFQKRFLALLKDQYQKDPGQFTEITGANALLERLGASPGWTVALATSGWGVTARFKLEAAGLAVNGIAMACGDDGVSREDIIGIAMRRARNLARVNNFAKIISLGDGVWDVWAARNLKTAFIGVGDGVKVLIGRGCGGGNVEVGVGLGLAV